MSEEMICPFMNGDSCKREQCMAWRWYEWKDEKGKTGILNSWCKPNLTPYRGTCNLIYPRKEK